VHPPTYGMPETDYAGDLRAANELLNRLEAVCGRLVIIEGNHEYRLDRWAAATAEGRGAYSMLAPRTQLTQGRPRCTYVR
jgi:predicted phosphohydrolase